MITSKSGLMFFLLDTNRNNQDLSDIDVPSYDELFCDAECVSWPYLLSNIICDKMVSRFHLMYNDEILSHSIYFESEFCIVLEHLMPLLNFLAYSSDGSYCFDFYEQGFIEDFFITHSVNTIHFQPSNKIRMNAEVRKLDFLNMLNLLYSNIVTIVDNHAPELLRFNPYVEWKKEMKILLDRSIADSIPYA